MRLKILFTVLMFSLCIDVFAEVDASSNALVGEFVYYVELGIDNADDTQAIKKRQENIMGMLLQEARYVFSSIIYGYKFKYTFGKVNSRVNDKFEVNLTKLINDKDENLENVKYVDSMKKSILKARYHLDKSQVSRYNIKKYNDFVNIASLGYADYAVTTDAKIKAIEDCIKNAVLDFAKKSYKNKPFSLSGEIFLTGVPNIYIKNGKFICRAEISVKTNDKEEILLP